MNIDMNFIPDGQSGDYRIDTFTVSKKDAEIDLLRGLFNGGRSTPAGTYKRLWRDEIVVMTNTPDEIRDIYPLYFNAKGHILLNGLGLGVALKMVLGEEKVRFITVIEISYDVINLIAPYFKDDRVQIICADAFEYKSSKGTRYNAVWHDIWDNICSDNLPEMHRLHRKYGRITDWQGSWCRYRCEKSK